MVQTRFALISVAPEKKEELHNKIRELYHNVKSKFKNFGTFQDVLGQSSSYGSKDLKDEQEPEEFANSCNGIRSHYECGKIVGGIL